MKILGVELKASEAILAMVALKNETVSYCELSPKKLKLTSDETSDVKAFAQTFNAVICDNGIDRIAIKSRNKKGDYAGGAVSFKIEGIIQVTADVRVVLLSAQTIAAVKRKNEIIMPDSLNKYQTTAFEVAFSSAKQ